MKKVIAFGNPLLDTTIYITEDSLLKKYNLKHDGQKEIFQDEMARISKDTSGYQQHKSAGGCSQNSLRVLQWLTNKQCEAIYFGSVGKDEDAAMLRSLLKADGVETRYITQDFPTGKTIGLVNGNNRSFVACLSAAKYFSVEDLLAIEDFVSLIDSAHFVYIEGFFLVDRIETAKYLLDVCKRHQKIILFNVCGEYLCQRYPVEVRHFIENAHIIFGSKKEFEALRRVLDFDSIADLDSIFFRNSSNSKVKKIVVMTDGENPGCFITENGNVTNFDIPKVDEAEIKDTVGAGDAFVAGFIAGLINDKNINQCVKFACYAASQIIRQPGCTLPNFVTNVFN